MFPIRDNIPSRTFPFVTIFLIVLNVLFFIVELKQGDHIQQFIFSYGIVPARLTDPLISAHYSFVEKILPFFSSMFLHGGWIHILSNMWFLWLFGDNVEDRMGHGRYLLFYLLCGFISALIHFIFNAGSQVPAIGASGAIAGVMGAYLTFYPFARIIVVVPILIIPFFFELYALFFIGIWFLLQIQYGSLMLLSALKDSYGIAWWAHIGGFVAGLVLGRIMAFGKKQRKRFSDEYFPW